MHDMLHTIASAGLSLTCRRLAISAGGVDDVVIRKFVSGQSPLVRLVTEAGLLMNRRQMQRKDPQVASLYRFLQNFIDSNLMHQIVEFKPDCWLAMSNFHWRDFFVSFTEHDHRYQLTLPSHVAIGIPATEEICDCNV
jgi:hypothetical protein